MFLQEDHLILTIEEVLYQIDHLETLVVEIIQETKEA